MLAALVGASRVEIRVHSTSETLAGLLLGGAVALFACLRAGRDHACLVRPDTRSMRLVMPALALAWLALLPWIAPPSQAHSMVTELALKLSGRPYPYLREPWLHEWRMRHPRAL